jgi:hypothetical protein
VEKNKGDMNIEGHPFPMNMIASSLSKGKFKVLTSERARKAGTVDSEKQISAKEYQAIKVKQKRQNSRYDQPETSRAGEMRRRPTSRILLNKWQRQQEKDQLRREKEYQEWLEEEEYRRYQDEKRKLREENEYHWNCPFFRHCWNEGSKLPTLNNCPECSDQYWEYRQSRANHRPVHERMDRRLKIESVHDRLGKRIVDEDMVDQDMDYHEEKEYVWQEGQWCPGGLTKSQKRRVQRLRNNELQEARKKPKIWQVKQIADKGKGKLSAEIAAAFRRCSCQSHVLYYFSEAW